MPVRSASRRGEAENDRSSACGEIIENGVNKGALKSDPEEELLTNIHGGNINGASVCGRPTTLNLRKQCPSSTTSKELSHSNRIQVSVEVALPQESNTMVESPRESRQVAHSNQIQIPLEVASPQHLIEGLREHSGLPVLGVLESSKFNINLEDTKDANKATRNSLLPASGCNLANQSDSLNTTFNAVVEQVCSSIDSEDQHLCLKSCDLTNHQHAQALCSSWFTPLYTTADEAESLLIDKQQSRLGQQHLYHDSSPSHNNKTFLECTSSVRSTAQETNHSIGYLADIEDINSAIMRSNIESHKGTECELYVEGQCKNKCESAQDHDEGILDQFKGRMIEITSSTHRCDNSHPPDQVLTEDTDDSDILYSAVVPAIQLPDTPCSGYVDTLPIRINKTELSQENVETLGLGDEVVPLPAELTDCPHGGYISNKPPQNKKKYQAHL